MIHIVKGFGILNKAEVDAFLEYPYFLCDPMDVGNLISGSSAFSKDFPGGSEGKASVYSAFSKSSLNLWKFTVYVLLKHGLENFKHYFASM